MQAREWLLVRQVWKANSQAQASYLKYWGIANAKIYIAREERRETEKQK